jgi:signal transduction histidine kinase/ligand-binding sensor domain-containing protein
MGRGEGRAWVRRGTAGALSGAALLWASLASAFPVDVRGAGVPRGDFPFVPFTEEFGGERLSPWDMLEEPDGTLWIATDDGLFRHDGLTLERFGADEGLPSPVVRQVVSDGRGGMWCLTQQGLVERIGATWRKPLERGGEAAALASTRHLAVDRAGRVWATTAQGLLRRADDGAFELDPSWPARDTEALFVDASGMLVGAPGALYERRDDGGWRAYGPADGLPSERIYSIARDGAGRVWVSASSRLFVSRDASMRFVPYPGLERIDAFLSLDRDGRLWVGSESGLYYASDEGRLEKVGGLPSHRVVSAFEDHEGTLWALGIGLFRVAGRGLWRSYTELHGLPDSTIWSVRRTSGAELWVGTQAGLVRGSEDGWLPVEAVPREPIRTIRPAPDGALWLSGPPGHVFRYEPRSARLETFGTDRGVPDTRTLALELDREGTIWVGSLRGPLVRSVREGGALRFVPQPLEGAETVRDILADREGRVWFASDHGLFMKHRDQWRRFTVDDGLRVNAVSYVIQRRSGEICAAYTSSGGLSCFRASDTALSAAWHLDAKTGLASDVIYILAEDARGRLWVGSNHGADVIDEGRIEHFGTGDGLVHADCDARAFWSEDNGDVWLGTSRGLAHFYGSRYAGAPAPPRARLLVRRQSEPTPVRDGAAIEYRGRALDVRFGAATFLHESAIEYETRLLGHDADWHPASTQRLSYAALEPGAYEMQVRARRPNGEFGPAEGLRFTVLAPWWQSWWFRGLCAAAVLAMGVAVLRWRGYALRRRNDALQKLVADQTRELADAHDEIARAEKLSALGRMLAQLSHELNNPVNVIANNLEPLREYVATMTALLAEQREAALALPDGGRALEQRWRESDAEFVVADSRDALDVIGAAIVRVQRVQSDLRAFLRNEKMPKVRGDLNGEVRETVAMIKRALPTSVKLACDYGELPPLDYEPGRLGQVFLNLLQNAVDAVGDEGTIRVRTYCAGDEICVEVADTGPGIAASVRDRIFEPFVTTKDVGKGTGLGLAICRQIVVEHHAGSITVEAPPLGGAAFVVRLPSSA